MKRLWWTILALTLLLPAGAIRAATNDNIDFAPLLSRDTDVNGDQRWRVLGPLFEWRAKPDGQWMWAARPLYSSLAQPDVRRTERNLLWPVWIGKNIDSESQWWLCYLMAWHNYDVTDPQPHYRFWILPIYFQGRDAQKRNYLAMFPIAGSVHEFLMQEEIRFVLFPLAMQYRMRDVNTLAFLWPLISRTTGADNDRFRVLPFYGYSIHGEEYDKRFILWPFWTSVRYGLPCSPGFGYILFPLYGHIKLENQETRFFVPPLFRFSYGEKMDKVHCPWPLFQWSRGEVDKLCFWPLWGRKTYGDIHTGFVLWPIGLSYRHPVPQGEATRVIVIPFVITEKIEMRPQDTNAPPEVTARYFKLWPFFTYARHGSDREFRTLSLWVWKDFAPIERNYAPLWTVYRHFRCSGMVEDELLWGLIKSRRAETGAWNTSLFPVLSVGNKAGDAGREWSLLKGLLGYERQGATGNWRLLYFLKWQTGADDAPATADGAAP